MDSLAAETRVPPETSAEAVPQFVNQTPQAEPQTCQGDSLTKGDAPPPRPLTLSRSYQPSLKKIDEDYHIGLSHVPLVGENCRPNPFYKPDIELEDHRIREILKEKFEKSWFRKCGTTINELVVLFENDARKLSHTRDWKVSFAQVKASSTNAVTFWEALCCPAFALKRMRVLALGVPAEQYTCAKAYCSMVCCLHTMPAEHLQNYECCQVSRGSMQICKHAFGCHPAYEK
jgi:hypothetical protein